MEIIQNMKSQIRPVPRSNGYLLMAAAGLLMISGISGFFLSLMSYIEVSLFVAAGALLINADVRKGLYAFSTFALAVALFAYSHTLEGFLLPLVAATLLFFSAIGLNYNIVPRFMPKRLALPALQIISAALALLCIPAVAREIGRAALTPDISPEMYHLHFTVMMLPFVSLLMISLAVEPKYLPARAVPVHCTKSAPAGNAFFVIASLLVLAMAAANLVDIIFNSYSVNAFLLALSLLAAAFLFLISGRNWGRFLAANALLLLSVAAKFFSPASFGSIDFLTYSLPILLMFVSAFGFLRNLGPPSLSKVFRMPLLNILAALLLLVNLVPGVLNVIDHVKHNETVAEARDEMIKGVVHATVGSSDEYAELFERFEENAEISMRAAFHTLAEALDDTYEELALMLRVAVEVIEEDAEENMVPLLTMLLCVMPASALLLLNLSIGSASAENKRLFSRFIQLCRRTVRWFYRDTDSKLQKLARALGVICVVAACLSAVVAAIGLAGYLSHHFFASPIGSYMAMLQYGVRGILASLIMALPTLAVSAFGRLTADIREIKEKAAIPGIEAADNPDELPEL